MEINLPCYIYDHNMSDEVGRKLGSKIDRKLERSHHNSLKDGFKKGKVINEVLDKPTVMTLYKMISNHVLAYVNGAVSAGKESMLFWGVDENGDSVALKVYLVSTSNFKRRDIYISGDPRFSRLKRGTRNMVYLWARKEFRNLTQCYDAGLPVPRPLHVVNNVLAMEFIGVNGRPAAPLLESIVDSNDYVQAISIIDDMYHKARLVHGDYSPYNIFKTRDGLVVFDMGSAVDLRHPNSLDFLKRDINNIVRFFKKKGIVVDRPEKIFGDVVG